MLDSIDTGAGFEPSPSFDWAYLLLGPLFVTPVLVLAASESLQRTGLPWERPLFTAEAWLKLARADEVKGTSAGRELIAVEVMLPFKMAGFAAFGVPKLPVLPFPVLRTGMKGDRGRPFAASDGGAGRP